MNGQATEANHKPELSRSFPLMQSGCSSSTGTSFLVPAAVFRAPEPSRLEATCHFQTSAAVAQESYSVLIVAEVSLSPSFFLFVLCLGPKN